MGGRRGGKGGAKVATPTVTMSADPSLYHWVTMLYYGRGVGWGEEVSGRWKYPVYGVHTYCYDHSQFGREGTTGECSGGDWGAGLSDEYTQSSKSQL